jgi:hypothetical protein
MLTIITRRRRAMAGLGLCCGLALVAAGCGSSNNNSTGTTAAGSTPPKNGAADAYKFSACMRTHGVTNFPDPVVHSSPGSESVAIRVTPALTSSPQFATAQKACAYILPGPKNGSTERSGGSAPLADELSFARCIRSHGFSKFPDPNAQGRLSLPSIQASGVDVQAPAFRTAALACVPASHGALTAAQVSQGLTQLANGTGGNGTTAGASPAG